VPARAEGDEVRTVATVYQVARLAGYGLLGALAGGIGRGPLLLVSQSWLRWLPWVLVLFFLALAFRLDRHLPSLGALGRLAWRLQAWRRGRSRLQAAVALGLATPLLPCGPLYFMVALGLLSGSAARGAEMLLAFGLGTVPMLWLAQTQFRWFQGKLSPAWLGRLRVGLAVLAALVIGWRLRATLGFPGPDPMSFVCF
jgi:sulfite exporter TauE/SafE